MTRTDIIKELERRGYKAECRNNIKNGIIFEGIVIGDKQVSPIIYTEKLIENAEKCGRNIYSVASEIIDIYEQNEDKEIPLELLTSKEFFMNHVSIGIQRKSNEDIEKQECELDPDELESYLFIKYKYEDGAGCMKINDFFLKQIGVSRLEAWEMARKNISEDMVIESVYQLMAEIFGMPYDQDREPDFPLYIITNSDKVKGASVILNRKKLKEFGKKHDTDKILVLPSSIHEMLISPYADWMDVDEMKTLVQEVNATEVLPEEKLIDKAYIVEL